LLLRYLLLRLLLHVVACRNHVGWDTDSDHAGLNTILGLLGVTRLHKALLGILLRVGLLLSQLCLLSSVVILLLSSSSSSSHTAIISEIIIEGIAGTAGLHRNSTTKTG